MYKFEQWPRRFANAAITGTAEQERSHGEVKPYASFTNNREDTTMAQVGGRAAH